MAINHDFCAHSSLVANEPMYGSAPAQKTVWLLLEYNAPWGAKVLPESTLSDAVKAHLNTTLKSIPGSNLLFIRQPGRQATGITFFVAVAEEHNNRLHHVQLENYEQLLQLDIAALLEDATTRHDEHLYLICTNSKRDACCARLGVGVYNTLREHAGDNVWQCSHIGGHRFAPTGLFLPHGLCYGRLDQADLAALVAQDQQGQIALALLRGRICYNAPVQAADSMLRQALNLTGLNDVTLQSVTQEEDRQWLVQLHAQGQNHNIRLQQVTTDVMVYASCKDDTPGPVKEFRRV